MEAVKQEEGEEEAEEQVEREEDEEEKEEGTPKGDEEGCEGHDERSRRAGPESVGLSKTVVRWGWTAVLTRASQVHTHNETGAT